jgi:hypothetical protein
MTQPRKFVLQRVKFSARGCRRRWRAPSLRRCFRFGVLIVPIWKVNRPGIPGDSII